MFLKKTAAFLPFVFIAALFLFSPKIISAQVVINEVFPNPSGVTSEPTEFIELLNIGTESITITGWKISDTSGSIKIYVLPDATLSPGMYVSLRREVTIIALNNDGDGLELKDPEGNLKDSMNFSSTIEDRSWSRIPNGTGTFVNNTEPTEREENSAPPAPTPTITNVPTPTTTPTPTLPANDYLNIYISEYMPYPESGNDEWVELYNDNDFEVNLNGWYLDDIENDGSPPKKINEDFIVSSRHYRQYFLGSSYLNNSGDEVRLLNGSQSEKDKTTFESSTQGKSWAKDSDGDWCEIDPTPNSSNPDCPEESTSTTVTANSTPTPTVKVSPTPTKKVTPSPTPTEKVATESGEILGEEATRAAFSGLEFMNPGEEKPATGSGKKTWLAKIFLGLGTLTLFGAGFSFWYTQLREKKT